MQMTEVITISLLLMVYFIGYYMGTREGERR